MHYSSELVEFSARRVLQGLSAPWTYGAAIELASIVTISSEGNRTNSMSTSWNCIQVDGKLALVHPRLLVLTLDNPTDTDTYDNAFAVFDLLESARAAFFKDYMCDSDLVLVPTIWVPIP